MYQFHTMCISETCVYIYVNSICETHAHGNNDSARPDTPRLPPDADRCNISRGSKEPRWRYSWDLAPVAPCLQRCWWSEHREWLGWKKRGSKPTSWVVCYMVGNYSKLGSSSHIPECAKFKANTLEGAQKYISRSPIPWFSNTNQWSQRTQSACVKLGKKQQNSKVFNPSNGIQINISQTFCFVSLPTEKVFKNFGYMSFN